MGAGVVTEDGPRPQTPAEAWQALKAGNARFVAGTPEHPNQGAERRHKLEGGQKPFATFFGCSDSRVAAEVIFDQGLGDLFVIRTAGHVVGPTALGSLEFSTNILDVPLIVVLGHDNCGAVTSTVEALDSGSLPGGYLRDLVERILGSAIAAHNKGITSIDGIMVEHVKQTVRFLAERSPAIEERVLDGRLAILGLAYQLADGRARIVEVAGDVGEQPVEDPLTLH